MALDKLFLSSCLQKVNLEQNLQSETRKEHQKHNEHSDFTEKCKYD